MTKFEKAIELLKFLKLELNLNDDIYQKLAALGWRWDKASQKWIHASNHPNELTPLDPS